MELHGFLNLDKPLGWTSHDVVGRCRRILHTKRVGHAGTLDPAATGVLVVGVGRATRLLDYVQDGSKEYVAHVVLGVDSTTADIDGRLVEDPAQSVTAVSAAAVEQILPEFVGQIQQIPPKYSAVKQDGEPLHRKVRRGEPVDVPVRTVHVSSISVLSFEWPDLVLHVECGSGVYIRSLAQDIGARLGTGGYLHHLIRTRVGPFTLTASHSLTTLASAAFPAAWTQYATSIDAGMTSYPALLTDDSTSEAWYHGRSIRGSQDSPDRDISHVRVLTSSGAFAGLAKVEGDSGRNVYRPKIVLPRQ